MVTGKSIKLEEQLAEAAEDKPQKPTTDSIKRPDEGNDNDMFEEKMMQSIIDSKGRDLYDLVYKVANEYRNERFSELSQIRIKAETTAILEDKGKVAPDLSTLSEMLSLVSSNMVLEDFRS